MLHKLEHTLPQQLPRVPQACDNHLSTRPYLSSNNLQYIGRVMESFAKSLT